MGHIALLGDSIFDNAAYVDGGPDVVAQLRAAPGDGWQASLLAVDGSTVADAVAQLDSLPIDTTHIVVSIGGNDILHHVAMLDEPVRTVGEAIGHLAAARLSFDEPYRAMVGALRLRGLPAAVCTIYDANFEQPRGTLIATALSVFNDVITRSAFRAGIDIIDLRLVCTEAADYANPIEPAVQGGEKIAEVVAGFARETNQHAGRSRIFPAADRPE